MTLKPGSFPELQEFFGDLGSVKDLVACAFERQRSDIDILSLAFG
jgi:hypothetical protein